MRTHPPDGSGRTGESKVSFQTSGTPPLSAATKRPFDASSGEGYINTCPETGRAVERKNARGGFEKRLRSSLLRPVGA